MKICTVCNIEKTFEEFSSNGSYKGIKQYRPLCRDCRNDTFRGNQEHLATRRKYEKTDKHRAYRNEYKSSDKYLAYERKRSKTPEAAAKRRTKRNKRYENDLLYKLKVLVRSRLLTSLKLSGFKKSHSTIKYLGCDYPTLKSHIETQFEPGMTWENHGEWEIDHIIPLASANCEERVLQLAKYTNLQPLWKIENRQKFTKLPEDLINK